MKKLTFCYVALGIIGTSFPILYNLDNFAVLALTEEEEASRKRIEAEERLNREQAIDDEKRRLRIEERNRERSQQDEIQRQIRQEEILREQNY